MMPPSLLDELEQTAKVAGVRVALCAAYHAGQGEELKAWAESLQKLDIRTESVRKFTPMAYSADWVNQEGD